MYHIYAALTCGDINLADSLIKDISDLQQPSLRVNAALLIYLSGWLAMLRGDARLALDTIEEGFASQTPADAGVHNFMTHGLILFAMAANENHLHHQALAHIAHARREYPGTEGPFFEFSFLLCEADITSKNAERVKRYLANYEVVKQKCVELEAKDQIRNWQPPITGEIIMETFNIQPSREVGIIKTAIREAILDGVIPNDYDAAFQMMVTEGAKLGLKVGK